MKSKLLNESPEKTWAVIFDKGDEVSAGLLQFAKENDLGATHFTAIGAFESCTLGYFDWKSKQYRRIPVEQQVEVVSLIGDIVQQDGEPKLHAHVVVGREDGSAMGGHLMEARVRPTLEVILTESPKHLERRMDPESGIALITL